MDEERRIEKIAYSMRSFADLYPLDMMNTNIDPGILQKLKRIDFKLGASIIFVLESGQHKCGFWKNPEYDRCYHLSISSIISLTECGLFPKEFIEELRVPRLTEESRQRLVKAFFQEKIRLLWVEPPVSDLGKMGETYHYRLFVNENGIPLLPRGEVYTRELTKAGWKSWSDVQYEKEKAKEMNDD